MPLTAKGTEILSAMQKEYGAEGERVFYASRNAGVISGVDSEYELEGKSVFNLDNMAEQIASLGSEAKRLAERLDMDTGRQSRKFPGYTLAELKKIVAEGVTNMRTLDTIEKIKEEILNREAETK
jgi:hypothetical protein